MKKPVSKSVPNRPDKPDSTGVSRRGFLSSAAGGAIVGAFAVRSGLSLPEPGEPIPPPGEALQQKLLACLGGPWPDNGPLDARREATGQKDGYRLEKISYLVEPQERIAAYLLVPDGIDENHRAPGICLWHQHAGQYEVGKEEPAGVHAPNFGTLHMTGVALAREGYVVLCPDAAGFGERNRPPQPGGQNTRGGDLERLLFSMYVVAGKSLAWKNILDMRRAVDYLAGRAEVQPDRLGCYGHSMGSTHTWMVGPWEPRLKALVGNCCMPTYAAMERTNLIHCFPNYVPGWRAIGDIPDIVGLIAPRPLHLNFGETDDGSPIEEVRAALPRIQAAYAARNAADRFTFFIEDGTGHVLSEEMWRRTRDHFARYLRA
jgi:dienelactone hydrolase